MYASITSERGARKANSRRGDRASIGVEIADHDPVSILDLGGAGGGVATRERERGELHAHLNGSIPLATIQQIVADEATALPPGFRIERDIVRDKPSASLAAYLTPWQVLRLFPKKRANLDLLNAAAFAAFAANEVRFVELRSSVLYLGKLQHVSPAAALERLIESTGEAARQRAIIRGLVLTVTRGPGATRDLKALLQAYEDLGRPSDVIGIDLAGNEEVEHPEDLPKLFRVAKDRYGLGVTIHAGETGRVANVRAAVALFGADRIGHGTAAGRDPETMDLLSSSDVCVEVCPISNRLTGAVARDEAHPLLEFHRRGTPFVICSDNPAIHNGGLAADQAAAVTEGLPSKALEHQYALAKRYSFIKDAV